MFLDFLTIVIPLTLHTNHTYVRTYVIPTFVGTYVSFCRHDGDKHMFFYT
jgi:hypothetical protein